VVTVKRVVEDSRVLAYADLGERGRCDIVARLELRKVAQDDGVAPDCVVKLAVNDGRRIEARHDRGPRLFKRQRKTGRAGSKWFRIIFSLRLAVIAFPLFVLRILFLRHWRDQGSGWDHRLRANDNA